MTSYPSELMPWAVPIVCPTWRCTCFAYFCYVYGEGTFTKSYGVFNYFSGSYGFWLVSSCVVFINAAQLPWIWNQVLSKFKSCSRRVGDLRWWESLTVVPNGYMAYRLSLVNHSEKQLIIVISLSRHKWRHTREWI